MLAFLQLFVLVSAFTREGRAAISTLVMFHGWVATEVPSPGVAAFIGFTSQTKLARFERTGASPLQAMRRECKRNFIGRGVLTIRPFV